MPQLVDALLHECAQKTQPRLLVEVHVQVQGPGAHDDLADVAVEECEFGDLETIGQEMQHLSETVN